MHNIFRNSLTLATLIVVCCAWSSLTAAPRPAEDDGGALVPEGPVEESVKPKDKPASTGDDEELLKAVEPDLKQQVADEIDRLERAIGGMRSAQKRIAGSDTSLETQKIQERVVKDLEDLLTFLKKQQQSRQSSQQNQDEKQDKNQSQNHRQKVRKDQGNPQNSGARKGSDPNDPKSGRRNDDKSADSQELSDAARAKAADEARRVQVIKDVWGHLPPHLRDAMHQAFSEKYLPKYEDLVKSYYEALAEKNRKRTGK